MKRSFIAVVTVAHLFAIMELGSGCAASDSAQSDNSADDIQSQKAAVVVKRALAELNAQMDRYAAYYDDSGDGVRTNGSRIAGCWANPAGRKLSDIQKAFYCSMPLEFRLCNTVKLLSTKETDIEGRFKGYLQCKSTMASILKDHTFVYSSDVDEAYRHLFLEPRADWAVTSIVAANRPRSGHDVPYLLAKIVGTLHKEADAVASDAFRAMIEDAGDNV